MKRIFSGEHPAFEAANTAFSAIFESELAGPDFDSRIELLRKGGDIDEVYSTVDDLDAKYSVVGISAGEHRILDRKALMYVSDTFGSIEKADGDGKLFILDGTRLYDLNRGEVIFDAAGHPGLFLGISGYDPETMLYWLVTIKGEKVNAVCVDDFPARLLLSDDSGKPLYGARFTPAAPGKSPTVSRMEKGDFWTVEADGGQYVVGAPGSSLSGCPFVADAEGTGRNEVLSADGYYVRIEGNPGEDRTYYLMKDGKPVIKRPFIDAGRESDGTIFLIDDSGEFRFDPETGETSRL